MHFKVWKLSETRSSCWSVQNHLLLAECSISMLCETLGFGAHLPKILSLELEFYQTQVLLHSGNTDDREWELQRLKLPDLHIRPKPNARKRWLTCKSVQLKSRGRTHRESLESPSQLPIHWHLWMLPRWKSPTQTRTNIIWGESGTVYFHKQYKSWTQSAKELNQSM